MALCNDKAEVQGVQSYSVTTILFTILSSSPMTTVVAAVGSPPIQQNRDYLPTLPTSTYIVGLRISSATCILSVGARTPPIVYPGASHPHPASGGLMGSCLSDCSAVCLPHLPRGLSARQPLAVGTWCRSVGLSDLFVQRSNCRWISLCIFRTNFECISCYPYGLPGARALYL